MRKLILLSTLAAGFGLGAAIHDMNGKWAIYADTDKDTLKNAPKFEYSKKKS